MGEYGLAEVPENEVSQGDKLGSAGRGREGVLTGPHREEKGSDDNVGGMIVLVGPDLAAVGKLEEAAEQSWGNGLLPEGWRVDVVEGFEERSEGGPKLGAVLDVNGALFETTPERRSQVACGIAHS